MGLTDVQQNKLEELMMKNRNDFRGNRGLGLR